MGRNNRRLVVFPGEAGLILLLFLWVFNENICGKMIGYSLVGKLKRILRSYGWKGLSGRSGGLKHQREIHSNWMKDERL